MTEVPTNKTKVCVFFPFPGLGDSPWKSAGIQKWLEMARFCLLLTWHIFTVRNPSFGMM